MARTTAVATALLEADDSSQSTDAELLERVRGGDRTAYGLLYERHAAPARRFARSLVGDPADADDIVAEVFASVLAAIGRGNGPDTLFAPYLMNSVRNECYRLFRRRGRESSEHVEDTVAAGDRRLVEPDPFERIDEAVLVRDAFETLSGDMQETLWRTVVEDISPAEFARLRGRSTNTGSVRALRARHALSLAYLDQHLTVDHRCGEPDPDCQDVRSELARLVRGVVGSGRRRRLEAHLARCPSCADARRSLGQVNRRLRVVPVMPFVLRQLVDFVIQIKSQIVGWVWSASSPVATFGAVAVAVVAPVVSNPETPSAGETSPPMQVAPVVGDHVPPVSMMFTLLPEAAGAENAHGVSPDGQVPTGAPQVAATPAPMEDAAEAPPSTTAPRSASPAAASPNGNQPSRSTSAGSPDAGALPDTSKPVVAPEEAQQNNANNRDVDRVANIGSQLKRTGGVGEPQGPPAGAGRPPAGAGGPPADAGAPPPQAAFSAKGGPVHDAGSSSVAQAQPEVSPEDQLADDSAAPPDESTNAEGQSP